VGEVLLQGPNVFSGYWNLPEATAEALKEGWFHTGDMGRLDEDAYLYIVDRKNDMVIVSGYNVYPIEIENILLRHPAIQDVAVIGVTDEYQGESVKAILIKMSGQEVSSEELEAYCREYLSAYKVPKYFEFRQSLPKTLTGKVLKRVLRAEESDSK
jgi:long-chain acyl-CoA synthetase